MITPRKIVDVRNDSSGNVAAVKLAGNTTFTSIEIVVGMAERRLVDAVPVRTKNGKPHLRSRPDGKKENNLDYLAAR